MKNSINKMEKFNQIINLLFEYNIRLKYFADDMDYLEYNLEITDENIVNKINNLCGDIELIKTDEERDDTECIETSIVYFKDYDLYIKEVATGECHYRDVCIDGELYNNEFTLVQPQEKVIIDFVDFN